MTIDLGNMEERLSQSIGSLGVNYLELQLQNIREARNLPKDIDDEKLWTAKFYLALKVLKNWLDPVAELSQTLFDEEEQEILELQEKASALVKTHNITQWYEINNYNDVKSLFDDLDKRITQLEKARKKILADCWRDNISNLVGIMLYPFADQINFQKVMKRAKSYFGPDQAYRRQNIYVDAIILQKVASEVFKKQIDATKIRKAIEQRIPEIGFSRDFDQDQWDLYRISQGADGAFSTSQAELLARSMLNLPRLTDEIRNELANSYILDIDRYRISSLVDWLSSKPEIASLLKKNIPEPETTTKRRPRYLLGLSFLDHHRRSDLIGNIPPDSQAVSLFEQIMAPFNELKQQDAFMQSANFEIDVFGLPPIVWLYDFLGVKSEILRSTLLLISERQPKFDILESCQRLANAVLGGRVDRNSYKKPGSNFFTVNLLPQLTWNYISEMLAIILEETLVDEEDRALRILRSVYAEEDRSQLVTSKKFIPAWQVDYSLSKDERTGQHEFSEVSVYSQKDFTFQPRHIQAAGYPWYMQIARILESLVVNALSVPDARKLQGNVNLKQVVFKRIEDKSFLVHYSPIFKQKKLTVMGFREAELIEEATSAVEVLHRPRKFLERGPEKNELVSILTKVSAKDPKDLYSIISNL